MVYFVLGLIIGGIVGMGIMCIFQFQKEDEQKNDIAE